MTTQMTFLTLCFVALFSSTAYSQQTCTMPAKAIYTITNNVNQTNTQLELYRTSNKIAQVYPNTQITEYWELNAKDQIKPTRFFNHFKRGIEYQPNELVHGKTEKDWSYRYQLVSQSFIDKAQITAIEGSACDLTHKLSVQTNNLSYEITYQPARQFVKNLLIKDLKSQQVIEHWEVIDESDNTELALQVFTTIADYQTTDFADIGDDHSDPFLTKMVALGFIESGASGYYHAFEENKVKAMGHHQH